MDLPIHPITVHFPIAFLLGAFLFEIASLIFKRENFHHTAWYLFIVGAFASVVSVLTGLWEANRLNLHHPELYEHRLFGLLTMSASLIGVLIVWLLRKKRSRLARPVLMGFLLAIVILVYLTGSHGGELVYEYGAGVSQ